MGGNTPAGSAAAPVRLPLLWRYRDRNGQGAVDEFELKNSSGSAGEQTVQLLPPVHGRDRKLQKRRPNRSRPDDDGGSSRRWWKYRNETLYTMICNLDFRKLRGHYGWRVAPFCIWYFTFCGFQANGLFLQQSSGNPPAAPGGSGGEAQWFSPGGQKRW